MNALTKKQTMKVTPIKEHIGAEITGLDLRQPLEEETRQALYDALVDNVVIVIRNQQFTAPEFANAGRLFGDLMEDQNRRYLAPGEPMVSTLSNRHLDSNGKQAKVSKTATWHTDHTNQEFPPKFTSLYPIELPGGGGGTAVFNSRAGFEALPQDMKDRITDMKTANNLVSSARANVANPDNMRDQGALDGKIMIQPLVQTHPDRGSKAIWFHTGKTENILGMKPKETQEFLAELLELAIKPEFTYVHEYTLGDMLIVDNRSALHQARFDYDHTKHRHLYRLLVRGDRPV
ncbi:MAG: TauD/TfdA family dioxygenase [Alphaproteobacteria bacterium]|nr:TauD/TfdA family dioxygenase [Alphaproteobacteria bacterium]